MLGDAHYVGFIPSTDLVAAQHFYGETLGISVVGNDGFALVLDAGGTTVRVAQVESFTPLPGTICGWVVDDIASTVDDLIGRGVVCARFPGMDQDDRGVWMAPGGDQVAWFRDPDGNTLSVTQPA